MQDQISCIDWLTDRLTDWLTESMNTYNNFPNNFFQHTLYKYHVISIFLFNYFPNSDILKSVNDGITIC